MEASAPGIAVSIVAVAVLYRQRIGESASVTSLMQILRDHPEWREKFFLLLHDNSPEPQDAPASLPLPFAYVHDRSNGGLAPAYQHALDCAAAAQAPWLMLLDQDTTLTEQYVAECLERIAELKAAPEIGGIAPKLVAHGIVYSPESDFLYRMRSQFRARKHPVAIDEVGVQSRTMNAYNSGAILRVSALQAVGGIPQDFWLDYLDHAIFAELGRGGFRLFVMQSALEQSLSHLDLDAVPHWRHRSVLTGQTRFILKYGRWPDRLWFRIYLLRSAARSFVARRNRSLWKELVLQAVALRVPSVQVRD